MGNQNLVVIVDQAEKRWIFTPKQPWHAGTYQLLALDTLEDVAGNQIGRAFEAVPIPLDNRPRSGHSWARMDLAAIERRLRASRTGAIVTDGRLLRRLIKAHRDLPGLGLSVPHAGCYALRREALVKLVDPALLGHTRESLPEQVILVARPTASEMAGSPIPAGSGPAVSNVRPRIPGPDSAKVSPVSSDWT